MSQNNTGQWFREAKYGLFIHWGLYSILGGEYRGKKTQHISEWIMNSLGIPLEEYEKLAGEFNPVLFDADALVKRAKEQWGMKYLVFTAKHHEGFSMYHSAVSAYNVTDATPCKRDILKEISTACQKYGMKLGLYYSQAQDWENPNGYASHSNGGSLKEKGAVPKDFDCYLENKVKPQLKELLTGYGEIGLLWFDTPMGMTKEQSEDCIRLVKSIQPGCLISGRIGNRLGDYMTTGDNFIPSLPLDGAWEVPATLNHTWGYNKYDENWAEPDVILRRLLKITSRGGNYLLNIGPDGQGAIPEGSVEVLNRIGNYVLENAEGIFGTELMPVYPYELDWAELTGKPHRMFIHVLTPQKSLMLLNCGNQPVKAYRLKDRRELSVFSESSCEGDRVLTVIIPEDMREDNYYCVCVEYLEERVIFDPL